MCASTQIKLKLSTFLAYYDNPFQGKVILFHLFPISFDKPVHVRTHIYETPFMNLILLLNWYTSLTF